MSEVTKFRKAKDDFFRGDHHSPLTDPQRGRFTGLEYFPENPHLRLMLPLEEFADGENETIEMATSTGDFVPHVRWGTLTFSVEGQSASLTVYRRKDSGEFFLPFGDATNGEQSYGAGRYLDLLPLEHGLFLLDFNYAYNPYCAYNYHWSCPIPPAENRLKVAIQAGEKIFSDAEGH